GERPMSDVKRCTIYEAFALLPYGAKVVPEYDYDALLAERDKLRLEVKNKQHTIDGMNEAHWQLVQAHAQLRAELEAIRGQQLVGYQYQDRNGEWRGFCDEEHYQNTVEDGTWPIRAIYAVVSTKNAEEGE
ncbi:hypothetical protein, partial [Metapseudomonas otitidis]|uniref:hypothetical protein n=1 Tax=Metapseudomonas otitidis TaxID=319939 RepID=UPI00366C6D75